MRQIQSQIDQLKRQLGVIQQQIVAAELDLSDKQSKYYNGGKYSTINPAYAPLVQSAQNRLKQLRSQEDVLVTRIQNLQVQLDIAEKHYQAQLAHEQQQAAIAADIKAKNNTLQSKLNVNQAASEKLWADQAARQRVIEQNGNASMQSVQNALQGLGNTIGSSIENTKLSPDGQRQANRQAADYLQNLSDRVEQRQYNEDTAGLMPFGNINPQSDASLNAAVQTSDTTLQSFKLPSAEESPAYIALWKRMDGVSDDVPGIVYSPQVLSQTLSELQETYRQAVAVGDMATMEVIQQKQARMEEAAEDYMGYTTVVLRNYADQIPNLEQRFTAIQKVTEIDEQAHKIYDQISTLLFLPVPDPAKKEKWVHPIPEADPSVPLPTPGAKLPSQPQTKDKDPGLVDKLNTFLDDLNNFSFGSWFGRNIVVEAMSNPAVNFHPPSAWGNYQEALTPKKNSK